MRDTGIMNQPDDMRTIAYNQIAQWTALPAGLKRDCRANIDVMEIAINAGEMWCAEQARNGNFSYSLTRYYVQTGMQWACAQFVAHEVAMRTRDTDQVMPLIQACDDVAMDAKRTGDHAARVGALKLKAQLQGALAPKQTETKVTISIADELAKRTKAVRERKQAEAKVIVDQSRPMNLQESVKLLVKDVNSDG